MKFLKEALPFVIVLLAFAVSAQQKAFKVEVIGEGKPILFFPGFTCTGDVYKDIIKDFSETNECHIFTFAGFGDVAPIERPWFPKVKEGVKTYITENSLQDSFVLGHSLGGTLALWLASEENSWFEKLIVVDGLPAAGALMVPNYKSENMVYDNPFNQRLLDMDSISFKQMATQMAGGMSLNKERQVQISDWIVQADRETYVYGYTDLLKLDLREDISKITTSVFILAATNPYGSEMARATYTEQYMNLENYSIDFAEGSAHFIMYDKPEWFMEKVMSFVR
ncbi:alpha/beta hydrolase [uncultured Croceitalea sp.]|uniref:alpha/beta fold hydrolase n=1 Tax=uncultured Croceitalea sp. TaxID=1798908 RepID=UPI0033060995